MSSVVDNLASIFEGISNLPSQIVNGIGNFFIDLGDKISGVIDAITSLPSFILEGIKGIFVPDAEQLRSDFNDTLESVSNIFGISLDGLEDFQNSWEEKPTDNIVEDYYISGVGTLKLKFFDTTYLAQGVERFRPVIRGFIVLLMILYNYYQILTFIGQDPRIMANAEKSAEIHIKRKESKR